MTDTSVETLVDQIEELLRRRIGLRPESTLRGRLRRSLRDEAASQAQTPEQFVDTISSRPDALQRLLDRVTVQETSFFRHPEHFRVLAETLLPVLTEPVTMWSAASSNGQEAYSLAMVMAEQGIDGSVVATDLSTSAVQRTSAGRYAIREMSGLTPARIDRHFTRVGDSWQINPELRRRVSAHLHNLVGPIPDRVRGCQVVFCRNVLIYFSPEHAGAFVDRVADALPGAAVFLGGAEAMWPISRRYETVRGGDTFWYRLPTSAAAAPAPTPSPPPASPSAARRPAPVTAPAPRPAARPPDPPAKAYPGSTAAPAAPGSTAAPAAPGLTAAPAAPGLTAAPAAPASTVAGDLADAGQRALAAGDHTAAIVAFRKCAYLTPEDVVAHLHLGLALEAAADLPAAQRAFGTARRVLLGRDPSRPGPAIGGYAPAELLRLLDAKQENR